MLVFTALVTEEGEEGGGDGWREGGHLVFHPLRKAVLLGSPSDTCSLPLGHLACQSSLVRTQAAPGSTGLSHVFNLVEVHRLSRPTPERAPEALG